MMHKIQAEVLILQMRNFALVPLQCNVKCIQDTLNLTVTGVRLTTLLWGSKAKVNRTIIDFFFFLEV